MEKQAAGKEQVKGGESWEIHFRRDRVRSHEGPAQDAELKGMKENGQDVEDGQDPGSHGPYLWDDLNMVRVAAGQMGLGTST